MHTDKDNPAQGTESSLDAGDSSQESMLNWLLELDRDEPEENLFVVDREDNGEQALTAFEAEIAARPMIRGNANADNFDNYVAEEIVISSESATSDIYTVDHGDPDDVSDAAVEELMAVEFSREFGADDDLGTVDVADGDDILGLSDDDDIGENFLVVKRVKRDKEQEQGPVAVQQPEDVEQPSDVLSYVTSVQPPVEDQAFDDYLVAGGQLEQGEPDIEELVLEVEEGAAAMDAGQMDAIDYHDDFRSLEGFDGETLSALTALLPELMEQLEQKVRESLRQLDMPDASVQVEFMPATDLQSVSQAESQGYQPLSSVCAWLPPVLQSVEQSVQEALYLKLVNRETGEVCNDLFDGEFAVAEEQQTECSPPVLSVVDNSVFDEDFLGVDTGDDLVPEGWEPADELVVFDEDIFAEDLAAEALPEHEPAADDIDALFEELGETPEGGDDICGLHVEEFAETNAITDDAVEVAQLEATDATEADGGDTADDMSWCIPQGINFSHSSPSSGEIFAEFLEAFIEEGSSELEKLEDAVSAWEAEPGSESTYTVVARILHTIKGIAKGVGLHYYGTLIHNFETLLEGMPRPAQGEEQAYFRIVNAWLDAAVRGVDHIQSEKVDIDSEFPQRPGKAAQEASEIETPAPAVSEQAEQAELVEEAEQLSPVLTVPAPQPTAGDRRRRQLDKKLADEGARALAAQQSVRITSEKLDLLLNLTNQAQQLGVRTAQSAARNKRASAEMQGRLSSVRAHIADIADRALFNVTARGASSHSAELDALEMDRYSELQEAANILREGVEDLADLIEIASRHNTQAEALLKQQATVISSIGSSIRAARVVPVSRLMPGLRRLVRTVSNDLGKDVNFRVANEVGTLDRDDYARCQTILEHMVRNALDHGIESAEEREASGKPATGQITVDVGMSGADSLIVLRDDGRGIDPEAMRESAIRKGLDIDVDSLSDEQALNLIFHKGFSTAASLSQISGRGVGMDIVLSELQQMGGEIHIESEIGRGTAFHIRIPSNVAVNGALLVTTGENSYAVPLGGLIAVDYLPVADFFNAVEEGGSLTVSGVDCEPAYLGTLCSGENLPDRKLWRASVPIIVAGSEQRYMAIAIDDVEEALELVVRSLGAQFASVPGVAGAATTAEGDAVVALDLNLLVASLGDRKGTTLAQEKEVEEHLLALVVDDSRTQRMVATSQLEAVGVETATAENGAVAIDLLNTAERLPDVILLDVEMPVKDGIQTLREIRKSARFNHIPVIMVTSRTGLKHRSMAEEAGCNGYMGKPFNFRMLLGQINELTGHRLELS